MTPILAELPEIGYLIIVCVVVAIVGLVGLAVILRFLRDFRSNLAKELTLQINSGKQPAPVEVQQPLIVKAHESLVTREEHTQLSTKMNEELGRERGARKQIHQEISDLQGDVKVLKSQNDSQTLKLTQLDGKMDQVLLRLPRPGGSGQLGF